MYLTIEVTQKFRSASLSKCLSSIAQKLEMVFENGIIQVKRDFGVSFCYRISLLAQDWGKKISSVCALDKNFARFLVAMKFNG